MRPLHERGWYAALSGFLCLGLALGLCRIAFAPVVPEMVDFHWTTVPQAGYLGSANFAGYFAGILVVVWFARRLDRRLLLRGALIVATLSLLGCAWDPGIVWLATCRVLQGVAGAALMTFVPGLVLQAVQPSHRRIIGGLTISGVGTVTLVASLLLPLLAPDSPQAEWALYGLLSTVITLIVWPFFSTNVKGRMPPAATEPPLTRSEIRPYTAFLLGYALIAMAATPNIVFLADYLHRDAHASSSVSSMLFGGFGVGLALGGFSGGLLAHQFGTYASVLIMSVVAAASNLVILFVQSVEWVALASVFFALSYMAMVALASLRTLEIVGPEANAKYWARMCAGFAVGQLGGSILFAAMAHDHHAYLDMFRVAQGALVVMTILFAASFRSAAREHGAATTS